MAKWQGPDPVKKEEVKVKENTAKKHVPMAGIYE
ncbi:hypothetical protein PspLS_00444 [Pyricularia sp. CBS 133598]|nr:hypothetical protein PspLS_00444 [Pyricularia sp. CBS 133598]